MYATSTIGFISPVLPSHKGKPVGSLSPSLQICIDRGWLLKGKAIHARAIKLVPEEDKYLSTKLVLFYAEFGCLSHARYLFDEMSDPNLVAWTIMVGAYARHSSCLESLDLFRQMQSAGLRPNSYSLATILNLCVDMGEVDCGKQIHAYVIRNIGKEDTCLESSLVDFYAKCGCLHEATKIFAMMTRRDVISWTIMINGYLSHNCEKEALGLFLEMCDSGIEPNQHTCAAFLKSGSLDAGKQMHAMVAKRGWHFEVYVSSCLIDMYMKNEDPESATSIFDRMPETDAVSFNIMISGYGRNGDVKSAVAMFMKMGFIGLKPNQSTYASILNGCADLGSICLGKQLHALVLATGLGQNAVIDGAIINMYAKCGSLLVARDCFNRAVEKTTITWNVMINGYGKHGQAKEALELFHAMRREQRKPDSVTFVCILSACSHCGFIREGLELFKSMIEDYRLAPENEHYSCMVDLLGRCGLVEQAYELVINMPFSAGPTVWGALLGACSIWGHTKIGEIAAQKLYELEPESSGPYVALANILSSKGRLHDSSVIREMMNHGGIKKEPGHSWIEIDGQMHKFTANHKAHTSMREIQSMLQNLTRSINE